MPYKQTKILLSHALQQTAERSLYNI